MARTGYMRLFFAGLLLLAILAAPALAQSGSIKLLAVSETATGLQGSVAYLFLDIQPGSGRVFIDTLPTAKIDTQLSTRFAKDMACKYLNVDCSNLDFFYTIRADSPIVGGPSAGAAITTLTISLLGKIPLDQDTVMTGTINSGELIGPVGGVKEKIDAAADEKLKRVLIPRGERYIEEENETKDMIEYGKQKGIIVVEVSDVDDVLYYYTGEQFNTSDSEVEMNPVYKDTMRFLSDGLCRRSLELKQEVEEFRTFDVSVIDADFAETKKKAENLTLEGKRAFDEEIYYSAASYCFGSNVKYSTLLFRLEGMSREEANNTLTELQNNVTGMKEDLDEFRIRTMTDLQAYMIVKDRLGETEDYINQSRIKMLNNSSMLPGLLALAVERYNSAVSWSNFLGQNGKRFRISSTELMSSCINKISEAEEQYSYVDYLFRGLMGDIRKDIDGAKDTYRNGDYVLCLYKATLTKAQIGVVSSSIGVKKEDVDDLLSRKLEAARKSIISQQENGIFPILGYSYYEYATSLREKDVYSALLYAEYALELSNLDIYFEPERIRLVGLKSSDAMVFFSGIAIGIMLSILVMILERRKNRKKTYRPEPPKHSRIKFNFRRK